MMNVGLLWFDGGSRDLSQKVARAAKRYQNRFGAAPNVCYVNPDTLPNGEEQRIQGVWVRPSPRILQDHFWVGQEATE
jgi:hypothetical protein